VASVRVLSAVATAFHSRIQAWASSLHWVVWLSGHHVIVTLVCGELGLLRLVLSGATLEARHVLSSDVWLSLSADQRILKRD
jgi:hypothetical protein